MIWSMALPFIVLFWFVAACILSLVSMIMVEAIEIATVHDYGLIAFDKRVTFWLQRVRSLPCACAYVALFASRLGYNHYAIALAYNAANAHAVTGRVEAKKLLSRRRQSEYKGNTDEKPTIWSMVME